MVWSEGSSLWAPMILESGLEDDLAEPDSQLGHGEGGRGPIGGGWKEGGRAPSATVPRYLPVDNHGVEGRGLLVGAHGVEGGGVVQGQAGAQGAT